MFESSPLSVDKRKISSTRWVKWKECMTKVSVLEISRLSSPPPRKPKQHEERDPPPMIGCSSPRDPIALSRCLRTLTDLDLTKFLTSLLRLPLVVVRYYPLSLQSTPPSPPTCPLGPIPRHPSPPPFSILLCRVNSLQGPNSLLYLPLSPPLSTHSALLG
jgi:hypothetical protein